ncbi:MULTISPECIES: IS701 family transposase [Streptomyces violaceusniger group]|uniref:IS701 family transposase n=1 Tax=Streptomyces violaceusniger group TaxID=2839105 RepID=UPI003B8A65B1
MPRKDQRAKGDCYLRGLMLDGRRKSIQAMASRLPDGNEQNLQQFVNQSTWDPVPVQRRICERMLPLITPTAWVIDDVSVPKDGRMSVAVARQYCGALGKRANCQVAVSVHAATDTASCPLQWRLFLPKEWAADTARRTLTRVPPEAGHREKWRLALDMLDTLADWRMRPPVVVADAAYGTNAHLRAALADREIHYVLAEPRGRDRPPVRGEARDPGPQRHRRPPASAPLPSARTLGGSPRRRSRTGSVHLPHLAAGLTRRVTFPRRRRARPPGRQRRRTSHPSRRLGRTGLVGRHPARLLAAGRMARRGRGSHRLLAVQPAGRHPDRRPGPPGQGLRWRIEHDYRELKHALGLDHFEGRSWPGRHHHVTLVTATHAFLTEQRLAPKVPGPSSLSTRPSTPSKTP